MSKATQIISLLESISDIVYHGTSLNKLFQIIKSDSFQLSAENATEADQIGKSNKRIFFMSLARNLSSGYLLRNWNPVILRIDGQKLSQKYKGGPVDYWGREFRKVDPKSSEQEDRLWSPDAFIKPASKYIKDAHIMIEDKGNLLWRNKTTRQALLELHKKGIKTFLYDDRAAFTKLNTAKSKPLSSFNFKGSPEPSRSREEMD